jgi:hypothetical protein
MDPEINRSYETRGGEGYEPDEEVRSAHKRGRRDPEESQSEPEGLGVALTCGRVPQPDKKVADGNHEN